MSKAPQLVSLADLAGRLKLPNSPTPASRQSLYLRLAKLGIVPQKQKPEGGSYLMSYVTVSEAEKVEQDFKSTHWKKFKAAKEQR